MHMLVYGSSIDSELHDILSVYHETTNTPVYLPLIAALTLLKQNMKNVNGECYCVKHMAKEYDKFYYLTGF